MLPGISNKGQGKPSDRPGGHEAGKVSLPTVSGSSATSKGQPGSRAQQSMNEQSKGSGGRAGKVVADRRGGQRRAGRKDNKKKPEAKEGPLIRPDSRVGKLLAEFGTKDDWVSNTIMRHQMAVVIQSCTRGFLVRQRWRENPQFVVDDLHRRIQREKRALERRAEAKKRMELKLLNQKSKASNVMQLLFGVKKKKPGLPGLGGKWGKLARNVDIAVMQTGDTEDQEGYEETNPGDDSDFSDLELEDIAAVKLRARTPPWQKVEQSQWVGQYNKLNHRANRGNVDVLWDTDECAGRLIDVKARRHHRAPAAAGHGAGDAEPDGGAAGDSSPQYDPSRQELPAQLIKELLSSKYTEKWNRLGLADYNPVRYGHLEDGLVDEGPMRFTAVRLGLDDAES